MFFTDEQAAVLQSMPPGYFTSMLDGATIGPAPHTVGDAQPEGMTCTINKDFYRFDYKFKRGTKALYLAETTYESEVWAKIRVQGMSESMMMHGYEWVKRQNLDVNGKEP
jgi:hypothetical protein